MPYSSPVEVALLQKGKAVQVEDIPRDGSPRNVPLNPDGGSNFVQSSLLWDFAALEQGLNKEP